MRAVLFDVDGTLLDVVENQRRVWREWSRLHGLDPESVWGCAVRTPPTETFALVAPDHDPESCLAVLHELEDADAREGDYGAFAGALELLNGLNAGDWALVTGNYAHRVTTRFRRLGLPLPSTVVGAGDVTRGKPHPEPYLKAASALLRAPGDCLAVEDSDAGIRAALAAGMTVWAVNAGADHPAAHRGFADLQAAAPAIAAWLGATSRDSAGH